MHIDETKFGMHENQNATNTKSRDDAVMLVAKSNVEKARNQDARCTALLSRVAHARRAFLPFRYLAAFPLFDGRPICGRLIEPARRDNRARAGQIATERFVLPVYTSIYGAHLSEWILVSCGDLEGYSGWLAAVFVKDEFRHCDRARTTT